MISPHVAEKAAFHDKVRKNSGRDSRLREFMTGSRFAVIETDRAAPALIAEHGQGPVLGL
jgi:hypothetical protein